MSEPRDPARMSALICADGKPVTLAQGPVIVHTDGGYCRAAEFAVDGPLTRGEAMALLLLRAGLAAMP
jgi:hypothetical protein